MGQLKEVTEKTKEAISIYLSDRPRWAKIVCITGTTVSLIGGALMSVTPASLPALAFLIPYSGYMTFGGSLITTIFQTFKKSE